MIVLPINSVINPLLYDDVVTSVFKTTFQSASNSFLNSAIYQSYRVNLNAAEPQGIEMDQLNAQQDESRSAAVGHQAKDTDIKDSEGQNEMKSANEKMSNAITATQNEFKKQK
jgi:hypothetical protein